MVSKIHMSWQFRSSLKSQLFWLEYQKLKFIIIVGNSESQILKTTVLEMIALAISLGEHFCASWTFKLNANYIKTYHTQTEPIYESLARIICYTSLRQRNCFEH